ncbi:MAG: quorum-sensing autoinducer synthase [Rhodospirillaceae bacterium]|jgi:CAI-1 autoinducer synthase|nr:quorum-sensing autoinducer synthase [Rhodospirillaceae bacterium]MBT5193857.1 quorum-sensing autoinducer synthase [Rhodospirillaceae bacterium]MBT6427485.1 quorum-sensing autoinducer synthase [Rhodospirillaceae bacterium]MBT7759492.1 quorum-sensing autoinducer synthase [Rhodospirillaceae bacterium]
MRDREQETTPAHAPENWGELPSLGRRIERYHRRIENGHPLLGRQPDRNSIELSGNDYLCLGVHSAIIEAQVAVMQGGGDDVYMSAAFLTDGTMQRAVERKTAAFLGTEDAVLCQSGWCANLGLMQAITDQDSLVYLDPRVHAAFWDGARSTGSKIRPFRHNSPESLESKIKRHGVGIVVVSAVYGSDGTVCPLLEIADIAERYGCEIVVDETHSIGVFGRQGQGLVSDLGLREKVTYRTFSLSKAMVTRAGMVTGPARILDFFRFESRPAIFSSAVLPHEVAGLGAALNVIQEEDWRRERLRRNTSALRGRLIELGFGIPANGSHIIPLLAGPEEAAIVLRDALERHDLFGTLICAPATTRNGALVRLSINSGLIEDDLQRIAGACAAIRDEIPVSRWPITLRLGVAALAGDGAAGPSKNFRASGAAVDEASTGSDKQQRRIG